jgi:hypothetical protein
VHGADGDALVPAAARLSPPRDAVAVDDELMVHEDEQREVEGDDDEGAAASSVL